ncbi:hypothetical protein J31TS4_25390 [Paenibacillus sp. J31TS4]|uniref:DUF1292 domain-containing protein n=1 Tax=Paenibacillus sp. J31TS4 TaxID=2807195 RepID=UPI001B2CB172|nr:DUF1292 domain-containing protein [Paenibacillus sp. J31TS4]GIP39259.1 hypothetical protein J31TS4_25390 [Paenibacillus sp. J31TS4]
MKDYRLEDVQPIRVLRDAYGDELELEDGGRAAVFRIQAEFAVGGSRYAVLESERAKPDDEPAVFRIVPAGGGWELETIEDDEEWELVAELYDEMTVDFDGE